MKEKYCQNMANIDCNDYFSKISLNLQFPFDSNNNMIPTKKYNEYNEEEKKIAITHAFNIYNNDFFPIQERKKIK
ncbi:MAG: hypothetical protein WC934_06305 [Acidithiobacillus sp.]|jgi:hypothetical protein|uniref:hypothetical protein n=1 Tax=Acidithiobacillus sp. TaxID=1872118 RepID=UPI00355D2C44